MFGDAEHGKRADRIRVAQKPFSPDPGVFRTPMLKGMDEPIAKSAQGVPPMIGQDAFDVLLKPDWRQLGA